MTVGFAPLRRELALWRAERRALPLWWRDDDAISDTPALRQLVALSQELSLDVHIAVIPAAADATLPPAVAECPTLIPMVHGWAHHSHAPTGSKNAEFGHPRAEAAGEIRDGLARLTALFGPRLMSFFVPPWNRIATEFSTDLAAAGYTGLSTYGARAQRWAAPGLVQINTHIDPIDWRGTRGLVPPERVLDGLVKTLQRRRQGLEDATEPLGYLTHHLVHDTDIWTFSHALLSELLTGGATAAILNSEVETGDEQT